MTPRLMPPTSGRHPRRPVPMAAARLRTVGLWTVALCLALPQLAVGFGIGIHPTTVEVGLRPGGQHRQVLTVGNLNRDKSLALTIGLADWSLDPEQQLILKPPGSSANSAADWVRFSPATLKLAPGESQRIVVEIRVPVEVEGPGDHRFGILVSPILPPREERKKSPSGVWSRVQVSSLFYVTIPPAKAEAALVDAEWRRGAQGAPEIVFSIANRGNSHSRIVGELRLRNDEGEVVLAQPIARVVLEGQTGRVTSPLAGPWQELPAGPYRPEFVLEDYEGPIPVEMPALPVLELPWLELPTQAPDTSPAGP